MEQRINLVDGNRFARVLSQTGAVTIAVSNFMNKVRPTDLPEEAADAFAKIIVETDALRNEAADVILYLASCGDELMKVAVDTAEEISKLSQEERSKFFGMDESDDQ